MRRFGRKIVMGRFRADLPLSPVWFDLLYLNGGPLIDLGQQQRFAELAALVPPDSLVRHLRTADPEAAEWGHGRRGGWLSNLHLGARDTENGGFAMLRKTFKGLTGDMLAWQTSEFLKLEIGRDRDIVYLRPEMVAEVAFNEIQVSPRYPGGLALRFERVKRYRRDKSAREADTFQAVQRLAGLREAAI